MSTVLQDVNAFALHCAFGTHKLLVSVTLRIFLTILAWWVIGLATYMYYYKVDINQTN